MLDEGRVARSHEVGAAETVKLPPLRVGAAMLAQVSVRNEPTDITGATASYRSAVPWICEFREVLVHSQAGIVCAGSMVVDDTLNHTRPATHGYREDAAGVTLADATVERLDGTWLSLLVSNDHNYYHWMVEGLGRLAVGAHPLLAECRGLLLPACATPVQADSMSAALAFAGFSRHPRRFLSAADTVSVERVVAPWTMTGHHTPHPALRGFFGALHAQLPRTPVAPTRRFYIERSLSPNRRLANEDAVIAALRPLGFVPVRLETLAWAEQVALFAGAEIVVAPHGAGLANLVYAPAGCRVIELMMDAWCCWCFRHLAAIGQLDYDCVVGRRLPGQDGLVHGASWTVSPFHVRAAVELR